ncbi:MAG: DUF2442 domain-containing protein [Eggerthellaceae bacterium]
MEWHLDKKIIDFGFDDEDTIVIDWNDGRRSAFDPYPYMKGAMEKLLDEDYLKLAYLTGYGRGIAWPGNLDFGVQLLYEASVTDNSEAPLPPRGPHMRWSPEALIVRLKFAEDGKILVDWSDGTVREFDAWNHANDDDIEKFVDPTYLAQARVTPERMPSSGPTANASMPRRSTSARPSWASNPRRSISRAEPFASATFCALPLGPRRRALPAGRGFPRAARRRARARP